MTSSWPNLERHGADWMQAGDVRPINAGDPKPRPTFVVHIDESGCEGFRFESGSSEWFVISAVVVRRATELATLKLVDRVREKLGRPYPLPLHFRDLKHEQKLPYIDEIARADLVVMTVFVHKPTLKEPETFGERYRLYFYATRYLLERVSWYCRDHRTAHDAGDGSALIVFSNRAGMSYEELRRYLDRLRQQTDAGDVRIDWNVVRSDQVVACSPRSRMGLLVADAVASGYARAVERDRHGFTEPRYARMLRPVAYCRKGSCLGYGLKFWPRDIDATVLVDERMKWMEDYK